VQLIGEVPVGANWDASLVRRALAGLGVAAAPEDAVAVLKLLEPLREACADLVITLQHDIPEKK
jgi:hypothetical protein